jgi:hypothetical protein
MTLATGIALLVHQTDRSSALLDQLEVLDRLRFELSGAPLDPTNRLPYQQLVILGSDGEYHPVCLLPQPPRRRHPRRVSFHEWWSEPVIAVDHPIYQARSIHTRRELVLDVRDTDGGAHVDPGIPPKYAYLSRSNALGWEMIDDDPPRSSPVPSGNPVPSSIRQIWFELEAAIDRLRAKK